MENLGIFPLLQGMSEDQLKTFGERCIWRNYEVGETIIDHHDSSNDVRFIATGTVRIVVRMLGGREVILNDYEAGDFFGELAAIDGGDRSASVSAITRTHICIMPQATFQQVCREAPDVAWKLMNHLTGMIRTLSDRLSEFSFLKAKHRLYAELLRLSRERVGHEGQRIISPAPVQSDIADRISSRREIVSRDMKELERMGILLRERGGLVILDPERLSRLAADGWLS